MIRTSAAWAIAGVALAACSGSQDLPASPLSSTGNTPVTFAVIVPSGSPTAKEAEQPHFVSQSTQSIVVTLDGKTVLTMDVSKTSKNCAHSRGSRRCTARAMVPSGNQTFGVTAFDRAHGLGNVLGTASTRAVLRSGVPQRIGLSLIGRAARLDVSAASLYPPAGRPATIPISIVELDADGNTILGRYGAPISLGDADISGATRLSTTTVDNSGTEIDLFYSGKTLATARISAVLPTLPTATLAFSPTPTVVAKYAAPRIRSSPTAPLLQVGISDICLGPDGSIWGTGTSQGTIERLGPGKKYTTYAIVDTEPAGISVGSDGNLWFAESRVGKIAKITASGVVTDYRIPTSVGGISLPSWTTRGPDGRTWYVDQGTKVFAVGAMSTSGRLSGYPLPASSNPQEIVAGSDGNLWITDTGLNAIVVLSTHGRLVAVHRLPTPDSEPWGITVGPDRNVWFAEYGANKIGRISSDGKIAEFDVPSAHAGPLNVASGPDGNVWYTETGDGIWDFVGKIGYVTTDGRTIRDFPGGTTPAHVHDLAFDPKGHLWYTTFTRASSALNELVY